MSQNILHLVISITALAGIFLALYIRHKKHPQRTLVCPLGSNCSIVIYSQYANFMGMPVEILGIIYYSVIFLLSIFSFSSLSLPLLMWLAVIAFLFSLYLTTIQLFKIKEWCFWCLMSTILSTIIFISFLSLV